MKPLSLFAPALALVLGSASVHAADEPEKIEPPVPVTQAPPPPLVPAPADGGYEYQQRHYGQTGPLIAPDKANQVVQAFRTAYDKLGKPRILFYVNRDLVDDHSGLKLTGRHEKTETTVGQKKSSFEADANAPKASPANPQTQVNVTVGGGTNGSGDALPGKGNSESRTTTVTGENTYAASEKPASSLADKMTVREVESLFGRPFRIAGAALADQKVASSLIADQPIDHFTTATNESERKDREALSKVADVVIEILVSSRNATLTEVSGDRTVTVPDIQVTAIRLSDSAIVGQASSTDVLGKDRDAARLVRQFGVRDITEATALALMEDMTTAAAK